MSAFMAGISGSREQISVPALAGWRGSGPTPEPKVPALVPPAQRLLPEPPVTDRLRAAGRSGVSFGAGQRAGCASTRAERSPFRSVLHRWLLGDLGQELVIGAERLQPVDQQLEAGGSRPTFSQPGQDPAQLPHHLELLAVEEELLVPGR